MIYKCVVTLNLSRVLCVVQVCAAHFFVGAAFVSEASSQLRRVQKNGTQLPEGRLTGDREGRPYGGRDGGRPMTAPTVDGLSG